MTTSTTTTGKKSKTTSTYPDLRDRTCTFARDARAFVRKTPRTLTSMGDARRLVHSSGAIGSYYIEADEAPSRQEFLKNIGNCRKNTKQTVHWLELMDDVVEERSIEARQALLDEAYELEKIFGAIIGKVVAKARKEKEEAS